jgi:hypothetical protein
MVETIQYGFPGIAVIMLQYVCIDLNSRFAQKFTGEEGM